MTTIAYRDGVLACDSRISNGDWTTPGRAEKIFRLANGGMVGFAGAASKIEWLKAWIEAGRPEDGRPTTLPDEVHAIVVGPDGRVEFLEGSRCGVWTFNAPFYAMGSGRVPALAAMMTGASAKRAIIVASALDPSTGGAVRFLRLKKGPDF